MVSIILIWSYIGTIVIIYGITAIKVINYLFKGERQSYPHLTIIFILGLCVVSTISSYLSLFINLGLWAFLLIALIAVVMLFYCYHDIVGLITGYFHKVRSLNKYIIVIFVITTIFIIIKSTAPPASFDTGLYHAQAIRWIEEYPIVPGLGNLHGRLAFNFSWFLPSALFSLAFLKIQPLHVLNPLLLLMVLIMSLAAADAIIKGRNSLANLLKVAIIIPIALVFKDQLSSPNVDMPTALITLVLLIYLVEMLENNMLPANGLGSALIAIIAAYVITIKLSAIALMILCIYIVGTKIVAKKYNEVAYITGMIVIIWVPWIVRGVILSGYLVYPLPSLDLFNFDWKIPLNSVVAESQGISNYARNPGLIPDEWLGRGLTAWLPSWLHYAATAYRKKLELILLPALFILGAIIVNGFKEKDLKIDYGVLLKNKIVYLTALAGLALWFVTAPDWRLGYGFIMITPLLLLMPLTGFSRPLVGKVVLLLSALALLYFEGVFLRGDLTAMKYRLVLPAPYPRVALQSVRVGEQVVYVPEAKAGQCWYASLPCTPRPGTNLEFRGANLADGFRSKKE